MLLGIDHVDAGPCYRCKTSIVLPLHFYNTARTSPRISFYCPYGHEQHFTEDESDLDKMRRERDRLAQQIAYRDDRIKELREGKEAAERRRAAAQGQVTKIKNRVGHGVCPCCNRTFENVARHMASQHPTFTSEAAE